jgi:hypothetical protein
MTLISDMGGKCVACGNTDIWMLEIDHVKAYGHYKKNRGAEWHNITKSIRVSRKQREMILSDWKKGLYQIMCTSCNKKKSLLQRGSDRFISAALEIMGVKNNDDLWGNLRKYL